MNFLNIQNQTFLIMGVANKKSIAYFAAKTLLENGAKIVLTIQHEENRSKIQSLFPDSEVLICDVKKNDDLIKLSHFFKESGIKLSGFLHSIAFANYSERMKPFHQTTPEDFFEAAHISCLSLITTTNALKDFFNHEASIVTISISNTRATSYGYMGPIKASLDSAVAFLAKSLSDCSKIRVNAVCAGPLKTTASAGIPGYIDNYLYAEKLTLRKEALKTQEVADTVAFLLSPRSSGINASGITVDAGMSCNYFDQEIVKVIAAQ